jgi:hypothetical protein
MERRRVVFRAGAVISCSRSRPPRPLRFRLGTRRVKAADASEMKRMLPELSPASNSCLSGWRVAGLSFRGKPPRLKRWGRDHQQQFTMETPFRSSVTSRPVLGMMTSSYFAVSSAFQRGFEGPTPCRAQSVRIMYPAPRRVDFEARGVPGLGGCLFGL